MFSAVLLVALSVALALELRRMRAAARRRLSLNRGLHELRRPMQALTLLADCPQLDRAALRACLEQARAGLDSLDATINGTESSPVVQRIPLADLTSALERRWRAFGVAVHPPQGEGAVLADPLSLAAAVDNLVANALRHGSGRVDVSARTSAGEARIEVRDEGPAPEPSSPLDDARRGHGLGIARDAALGFGGALLGPAPTGDGGTLAALTLPSGGPGPGG